MRSCLGGIAMKLIVVLVSIFWLSGCAMAIPRPPVVSEFQMSTSKDDVYKKVGQALLTNGFSITLTDPSIGIIKSEKSFTVSRGLLKIGHPARAMVQVMLAQEKAVVQTQYECLYGSTFLTCPLNDKEAEPAIKEIEKSVRADLAKVFQVK